MSTEQEQPQRYIIPNLKVMSPTMLARIEENAPLPILYIRPTQHDGKLTSCVDDDFAGEVWIDGRYIGIEIMSQQVVLEATQALSLLAWLKQEEEALQRLVEDEEEEHHD